MGRHWRRPKSKSKGKGKGRARRSSTHHKENAVAAKGRTDVTLKESAAGGWETGSPSKNNASGSPAPAVRRRPKGGPLIAALGASARVSLQTTDYSSDEATISSAKSSCSSSVRAFGRSSDNAASSSSGVRSASCDAASLASSPCMTPAPGQPLRLRQQNSITSSEDSYVSPKKRRKRRNRKPKKVTEREEQGDYDSGVPEECTKDSRPVSTRAHVQPRSHRTHYSPGGKRLSTQTEEVAAVHTQDRQETVKETSNNTIQSITECYEENNNKCEKPKNLEDKKRFAKKRRNKRKKTQTGERTEETRSANEAPSPSPSDPTGKKEVISIEVEGELHYESEEALQDEVVSKGVDGFTNSLRSTVQMLTDRVLEKHTSGSGGSGAKEVSDTCVDLRNPDYRVAGAETLVYIVHAHNNVQQAGASPPDAVAIQSDRATESQSAAPCAEKQVSACDESGHKGVVSDLSEVSVDRTVVISGVPERDCEQEDGGSGASCAHAPHLAEVIEHANAVSDKGVLSAEETFVAEPSTAEKLTVESNTACKDGFENKTKIDTKVEIDANNTESLDRSTIVKCRAENTEEVGLASEKEAVETCNDNKIEAAINTTDIMTNKIDTDVNDAWVAFCHSSRTELVNATEPNSTFCTTVTGIADVIPIVAVKAENCMAEESKGDIITGTDLPEKAEVAIDFISEGEISRNSGRQGADVPPETAHSLHAEPANAAAAATIVEAEVAIIRSEDNAVDATEVVSLPPQVGEYDGRLGGCDGGRQEEGGRLEEEATETGTDVGAEPDRLGEGGDEKEQELKERSGERESHVLRHTEEQGRESEEERRKRKRLDSEEEEEEMVVEVEELEEGEGNRGGGEVGVREVGDDCIPEGGLVTRDSALEERSGEKKEEMKEEEEKKNDLLITNTDIIRPSERLEIDEYITGRDETEPDIVVVAVEDRNDDLIVEDHNKDFIVEDDVADKKEQVAHDEDEVIVAVQNKPAKEDVAVLINDNILSLNPAGTRSVVDVLRSSGEHEDDIVIIDVDGGHGRGGEGASTEGEGEGGEESKAEGVGFDSEKEKEQEEEEGQNPCENGAAKRQEITGEREDKKEESKAREDPPKEDTDTVHVELPASNVAPTVDAALAELDSIPDGVCEAGDVEEEEEDEEEWSYFRMEPQTQPQGEDVLLPGGPAVPAVPKGEVESQNIMMEDEGIVMANQQVPPHEDLLTSPMEGVPQAEVYSEKLGSPLEADQPPAMENPPDILQASVEEVSTGFESTTRTLDLMQTSMDKIPDLMEGKFDQPSSPQGSLSPRVPGSPRSVEGFVTSVELNTPEENFAITQNPDSLTNAMEQSSGPFSVYVSSSPEPTSLEPSLQAPVDLVNFSGVANGQVEEESSPTSPVAEESPVEIVHAQSTVEVVAPPSPVDLTAPEAQFIIPEQEATQVNTEVQQPSDITFVPEKVVEPVAEVPVSVFVDETSPVSEPDTADLLEPQVKSPVESTPIAEEPTPAPVEELVPAPVEELVPAPVESKPIQEEPVPAPVEPVPAPIEPVPAPVEPEPAPVEPTPAPVEPTPAPAEPTPAPAEPEPAPAEPEPVPAEPTPAPAEPTPAPAEPAPAPAEPTPAPVEPAPAPAEPSPAPVEPAVEKTAPVKVATKPSKDAAKPATPTPKTRTVTKTTAKTPVSAKATPDKKPTPGKATPTRPTPGKATPTRTPITKTPTTKVAEKTASPRPSPRTTATKPATEKPTTTKPTTARPTTRPTTTTGAAKPAPARTAPTKPLLRKPAEKPATSTTTTTTTRAPASRTTAAAPRPGSARPAPSARTSTTTTTSSTVRKTAPTKTADKPASSRLVNGSATRTTTTASRPLAPAASRTTTTRPAAEKDTKNTTNRILSTTRPASKTGTTTGTTRTTVSRTAAAAKSTAASETKTTSQARTTATSRTAATKTAGVAVKKTLVSKTKTAGTKTAVAKAEKSEATVLESSTPVVNGENKIADEETSVEVIEKCAVEDIMKSSSEKIITESSQTMTTSEQVVVTTETTEVIVNGDH